MIYKGVVVACFEIYSRYFAGRTEEKHESLRIGGLRAEIRNQDLSNMKHSYYPLDRDGERIVLTTDLPNKALRKKKN
jgi:hypothetical protein